jgi:hypothetical protein
VRTSCTPGFGTRCMFGVSFPRPTPLLLRCYARLAATRASNRRKCQRSRYREPKWRVQLNLIALRQACIWHHRTLMVPPARAVVTLAYSALGRLARSYSAPLLRAASLRGGHRAIGMRAQPLIVDPLGRDCCVVASLIKNPAGQLTGRIPCPDVPPVRSGWSSITGLYHYRMTLAR